MDLKLVKNSPFDDVSVSAWDYSSKISWKEYNEMFKTFCERMQKTQYPSFDTESHYCGCVVEAGDYLSEINGISELQKEVLETMLIEDYTNHIINN